MKLVRTIAMNTDHDFYANPTEVTRVELYMDPDVMTPEAVEIAKRLQVERLHSMAKAMPHRYQLHPENRPYASELSTVVPSPTTEAKK